LAFIEQGTKAIEPHNTAHAGAQFGAIKRLADKIVGTGINALQARCLIIECGHEHNWDEIHAWIGTQAATDLKAIHTRHHHIKQHQIGHMRVGQIKRLGAITRQQDAIVFGAEHCRQCFAPVGLIINDQYRGTCGHQ
jgi:hypothetical protein